jgi:chaperonin cofactor prefoldin
LFGVFSVKGKKGLPVLLVVGLIVGIVVGAGVGYGIQLGTINSLQNRVGGLQLQASSLTANVTSLGGQIAGLQSQISALASDKTSLQSQVSSLQSDKAALQSRVSGLQLQISSLGVNMTSLQGQISSLQSDKASLQSDNARLQSQLNASKNQVASLQSDKTSLQNQISSLQANISELEKLVPPVKKGAWNLAASFIGQDSVDTGYFYVYGADLRFNWTWSTRSQYPGFGLTLYKYGQDKYFPSYGDPYINGVTGTTYAHGLVNAYYYLDVTAVYLTGWIISVEVWVPA